MSPRALRLFLAAVVAFSVLTCVTAFVALPASDASYFAGYVMVLAVALVAARRERTRVSRAPWALVIAGQLCWLTNDSLGLAAWYLQWETLPVVVLDVVTILGYLGLGGALIVMARRRARGQLRAGVLDMMTLATAAAIALWRILVEPVLAQGELPASAIFSLLYRPLGDVLLLAGVLLLVLSPGARGVPTRLLVTSTSIAIVCDVAYGLFPVDADAAFAATSGLILLSNGLLIAALAHPGSAELTARAVRTRTLHPARVLFLGAALVTAPILAVTRPTTDPMARTVLLVATVLTAGAVLARFTGAVREQERAEQSLAYQADHDALTGLVNRRVLHDSLDVHGRDGVQLYIDLDGFKAVNDLDGHEAGDAVLLAVAERLRCAVRHGDVVARLGGDEFAVLCVARVGHDEATALADRIVREVAEPVPFEDQLLTVGASVGMARGRDVPPGDVRESLLRAADAAMYEAKRLGRGRWIAADASLTTTPV